MRMMNNSLQVGILKVMMTLMEILDNLSRMRNLKEGMLVLMISLQVRILKPVMRMMKNISQVAILKVVNMITPLVVTLSQVIN